MPTAKPETARKYSLHRHPNDGSPKDWAFRVEGGDLLTRWGGTDVRLTHAKRRALKYANEGNDLAQQKLGKGYRPVGEVWIDEEGFLIEASRVPQSVRPGPAQESALYWRMVYPATLDAPSSLGILNAMRRYADALSPWTAVSGLCQGSIQIGDWQVPAQGQAGRLERRHGVWPFLWMMALKRLAPHGLRVTLATDDSAEIGGDLKQVGDALGFFGTDLESVRPAAEALGLLERRIDFSEIDTDVPDFSF